MQRRASPRIDKTCFSCMMIIGQNLFSEVSTPRAAALTGTRLSPVITRMLGINCREGLNKQRGPPEGFLIATYKTYSVSSSSSSSRFSLGLQRPSPFSELADIFSGRVGFFIGALFATRTTTVMEYMRGERG